MRRIIAMHLIVRVEIIEDALKLGRARYESVLGEKLDEHDGAVPGRLARLVERDEWKTRLLERIVDAHVQIIERIEQGAVHIEKYCIHNASFL